MELKIKKSSLRLYATDISHLGKLKEKMKSLRLYDKHTDVHKYTLTFRF